MKVVHNKLVVIDWRNQILLFTWHLWPMTSRQLLYSCSKLAYILLFNNHNQYMCNISVYFPTGGRDMKLTLCFMCSIWVWEWLPLTVTTVTPLCRLGRKCCSAKWVGCYVTLLLPVVLSLILLITLSQVPATDNIIHPGIAVQNDTVELQFNLPVWWLSGVTLEIKNTCAGKVFLTKGTACGALATVVEYLHENFDTLIYMLPTSVIYFNIPENSKTLLWIFSDNDLYLQYLDQPQQFDCAAVPPKSVCVNTSQHFGSFQYNVTNAGYISIACDDAGTFSPCFSEGLRWYFERYLYNYREIVSQYEPVATLNERRGSKVIHFNSLFNFQPFCVLLHIDADSCTSPPHEKWNVLNVRKREDILLFPGIISLIFISFIPCLAVFHWVRTKRSG